MRPGKAGSVFELKQLLTTLLTAKFLLAILILTIVHVIIHLSLYSSEVDHAQSMHVQYFYHHVVVWFTIFPFYQSSWLFQLCCSSISLSDQLLLLLRRSGTNRPYFPLWQIARVASSIASVTMSTVSLSLWLIARVIQSTIFLFWIDRPCYSVDCISLLDRSPVLLCWSYFSLGQSFMFLCRLYFSLRLTTCVTLSTMYFSLGLMLNYCDGQTQSWLWPPQRKLKQNEQPTIISNNH